MAKVIKMDLSTSSIDEAIKELKAFKSSLDEKRDRLLKRLADIGVNDAQVRFATAAYDGVNDSRVTVRPSVR